MAVKRVMFASNGSVAVFDTSGRQVTEWQTNVFCDHLRKMLNAGAVTLESEVETPLSRDTAVRDWIGNAVPEG